MELQRIRHDWVTEQKQQQSLSFVFFLLFLKSVKYNILFTCSVMSDSLQPHRLQHARLPCPSPSSRVCSNSGSLSQWCHPTISSSVIQFSSCPQSFPVSGYFLMSQLFTLGGPSIGASVSASVLPMNIQDWFPLGLTGLISLQSKELSRVFSSTTTHHSHPYITTGKTIILTIWTFFSKVMSLLFNLLSRFVIAFFPRGKCLLSSWLHFTVHSDFGAWEIKSVTVSTFSFY